MDEKEVRGSFLYIAEEKSDSLYPMCFGVSCAFFALRLMARPNEEDEKWSDVCSKMLQGSAQLLGLLVWKVQRANEGNSELLHKLESTRREIVELKRIRSEDAKANEKVVGIFNSREQSWLNERRKLWQHIESLMNEIRSLERKKDEEISELQEKLKDTELLVQSKEKMLADEAQKRKDFEEKLAIAENAAEELKEVSKREAEEHSSEIWKHKTAFVELVSNQRQLEAEMKRAYRQVEFAKQELKLVLAQKEESDLLAQKLSMEVVKTRKDLEQKERILSAMMRKSKLDMAEKQMLLKELQSSKAKRKQAELETEQWKAVSESKCDRYSSKNMLSKKSNSKWNIVSGAQVLYSNSTGFSQIAKMRPHRNDRGVAHELPGMRRTVDEFPPIMDPCSREEDEELAITGGVKHLEGSLQSEAEKYTAAIEQMHHLELEAFAEQMRLKDEKIEALNWQFLSVELESKQLKSHVEELNHDISQLRHDNMRLESLLLEQEKELSYMKERLTSQPKIVNCQKKKLRSSIPDPELVHDTIWSKVKIMKKKIREREHEKTKLIDLPTEKITKKKEEKAAEHTKNINFTVQSSEKEKELIQLSGKEKDLPLNPSLVHEEHARGVNTSDISASSSQLACKKNDDQSKMDLHALGISYKIKRLKQQLLMVERLTEKQGNDEATEGSESSLNKKPSFHSLISLLNKQVGRYQSLQGKADTLCKRMHENKLDAHHISAGAARTKDETRTLEQFLEETFQLQRYIVATGQKLMEVQSKMSSELAVTIQDPNMVANFDVKKFSENIRALLQDIQRGLEVRISRIIGDLEGTLARDGMIRLRR